MGRKFIRLSLALKFRLTFGLAMLGVIAVALVVPWFSMEVLRDQGLESTARNITRIRLNEWASDGPSGHAHSADATSGVFASCGAGQDSEILRGPSFRAIWPSTKIENLDSSTRNALNRFGQIPHQQLVWRKTTDDHERNVYRCFRAVRNTPDCAKCHTEDATMKPLLRFAPGQLVGLIDVTLPASAAAGTLLWVTRGAFLAGGILAGVLALVIFAIIAHRIVLRPVRDLRELADKVAEGATDVRSSLKTGDELQRLGESFNEMLSALGQKHSALRSANRALDLKLEDLSDANKALFQANRVKTEFLASVSHELRTPLNSIIGFADLLRDAEEKRTARFGNNISTAAKNLLAMINDMLDLARIEAGKADVRFDPISILDLCRTLVALMGPLAEKQNLTLAGELDEELPVVNTDAGKLQQILYNLLSNAVKFTPPGGQVTLRAKTVDDSAPLGPGVQIEIQDTGPGISEAEQAHVFEKFYQSDSALTRRTGGAGLGLAISRELAGLLGGRLTLQSEPGHGATFILRLPLKPPPEQEENEPANVDPV